MTTGALYLSSSVRGMRTTAAGSGGEPSNVPQGNIAPCGACCRTIDNLVWSYSPNLDGNCSEEQFLERYPGDDRVDLIGLDAYQWGTEEDFVRQVNSDLRMLTDYTQKKGKLLAMTECGLKNLPDPTWWTRVLKPQIDKYPICYFLVWRNARHEYFGPAPGEKNAVYFNEMVRSGNVLMLKDIVR